MCGIFGILNIADSGTIDKKKVTESSALMHHRGPNAFGQWGIDQKVELAHLRLSIIDLSSESNQPYHSACGNYVIVFNGEIYNYLEIKNELISLGKTFRTSSDTEVLLNSFIEWGEECVNRFNGDWAFAIYNIKDDVLFCSRDRFGVKPLNYACVDGKYVFSSEIKSILHYYPQLRTPNYNVISNYCRNSLGAQTHETWFKDIFRLRPAHNIIVKNGKLVETRYWDYPKKTIHNLQFEDATNRYRDIFLDSVKLRMRSDVPVGTTLSSGIDSSSIVSILRKFYTEEHNTFTAVFDSDEYRQAEKQIFSTDISINEGSIVKRLSADLKLKSHFIEISKTDFCSELSSVIYFLESGNSSPATLPLSKIMSFAKNHVTVVMEGQGADELLSGYIVSNFIPLLLELLREGKIQQCFHEYQEFKKTYSIQYSFKQFMRLLNIDSIERVYQWRTRINKIFGPKLRTYHRIKDYPYEPEGFDESFNKALFKSHTGGLVNLLHYGDAISLSHSIESRLPFMDVNLVEFSFQLPYEYKMQNGLGKYIHRMAMKNIVPDYILNNPLKFGFNTPLSQHFESLHSDANQILLSDRCLSRGIFQKGSLEKLIQEHISNKMNHSPILFRLLSVELWFRLFIDTKSVNYTNDHIE